MEENLLEITFNWLEPAPDGKVPLGAGGVIVGDFETFLVGINSLKLNALPELPRQARIWATAWVSGGVIWGAGRRVGAPAVSAC